MSGIDVCLSLLEEKRAEIFSQYVELLKDTRKRLSKLKNVKLISLQSGDNSKLILSVKGTDYTGSQLYQRLLQEYHLQMEMVTGSYVLGMTSIADTRKGMERLVVALTEIDKTMKKSTAEEADLRLSVLEQAHTIAKTKSLAEQGSYFCDWQESEGRIATEFAYLYPPGIPLIVPGERVNKKVIKVLEKYTQMQFTIVGLKQQGKIEVLKDG